VGVVVAVGTAVGVGVAVGVGPGVTVSVGITVAVGLGDGVFSSSPPPQADSKIGSNRPKTVNTINHRFMGASYLPRYVSCCNHLRTDHAYTRGASLWNSALWAFSLHHMTSSDLINSKRLSGFTKSPFASLNMINIPKVASTATRTPYTHGVAG